MKAKPFLAQRWEDQWDKPVAQWREELNVQIPSVYMP
jgi:ubiquinone biosynthesis protein COQ4